MNEKELWKSTKIRYLKIKEVIEELLSGIKVNGSTEYNIPKCQFCVVDESKYRNEEYQTCSECGWGKIFGECEDDNSEWHKMSNNLFYIKYNLCDIIEKIDNQINKYTK